MSIKLSVIMPVYNAEKYLEEAINSILKQTFKEFEFLILNDNSSDTSIDIIRKFIKVDHRIKLINKSNNIGPALLRNEGFDTSQGEFIALMDADDIADKTRFEKQLNFLDKNKDIGVCGTWYTMFGQNIESNLFCMEEFHDEIKINMLIKNCIGNPTAIIRKKMLDPIRYDKKMVPIEDYDLWTKLLTVTKFYNIQESLLQYRWHETNITKSKQENSILMHKMVYENQLKEFKIKENNFNITNCLLAINFKEKQEPEKIIEIIKSANFLIAQNLKIKQYNQELFEKKIYESINKTILDSDSYNVFYLKRVLKFGFHFFKTLKLKKQFKIIFKAFF